MNATAIVIVIVQYVLGSIRTSHDGTSHGPQHLKMDSLLSSTSNSLMLLTDEKMQLLVAIWQTHYTLMEPGLMLMLIWIDC